MNRFVMTAALGFMGMLVSVPDTLADGRRGNRVGGILPRHGAVHRPRSQGVAPLYVPAATYSVSAYSDQSEEEAVTYQTCRYLRLKNETGQKLTVYLQYRTQTTDGKYRWYPEAPATATKALVFQLKPGAESELYHDDWQINACRVRIWAVAADGSEWLDYKDTDLWLVEADDAGERYYQGSEMETFTFSLKP